MFDRFSAHALPLLALAAALVVGGALVSQYGFGLQPCVLCLYQRWPYYIIVALGLVAWPLTAGRPGLRRFILALIGLIFLVGAGIALFHVGVESHWWEGTAECGGNLPDANSIDALRAQLLATKPVRCDEPALVVLGLSMAGWNMLAALALALLSFGAARRA
jgi:disulfide bond formation protein DsbB